MARAAATSVPVLQSVRSRGPGSSKDEATANCVWIPLRPLVYCASRGGFRTRRRQWLAVTPSSLRRDSSVVSTAQNLSWRRGTCKAPSELGYALTRGIYVQPFFGLREHPFNINPDPRYLFLTPQTQRALDQLTYGIQSRQGLILLTGEVGTG